MPPRISHHRRGTTRGDRRASGGRVASAPAYTPASDPLSLLWWDPTTVSGAVSAWVDKIAGVTLSQGTGTAQPTASATAISGAYAGVTSDGGDGLAAAGAGAVLVGKTTVTVTAAMVGPLAFSIALEYGPASNSTDGTFGVLPNATGLRSFARGITGHSQRDAVHTLTTPAVISYGFDVSQAGAGAVSFVRVNGVAKSLTAISSTNVASTLTSQTLYLFARTANLAHWAGTFGDVVIRNSAAENAALEAAEDFVGARIGLSF